MRVLVTGAGGFVGFAVAELLAQREHEVTGLTRSPNTPLPPNVCRHVGDLLIPESVAPAMSGVEGLCHLAGLARVRDSRADPVGYWRTNAGGTLAVLDEAQRSDLGVRLVLASTAGVYSDQATQPLTEHAELAPTSPYARSKLAADLAAADLAATGAIGATSLRTFNVAGAIGRHIDPDLTRLIPKLLAVQLGEAPELVVNGDGSAVRDFVHVADMAAAFVLALEACELGKWSAFNVGSGRRSTVRDAIETVEAVTGRSVPRHHAPPAEEPPALLADSSRITAELGWQPENSYLSRIISDAWGALTCG
ncbi:MAG: NAD-dependent epimerase/dehydratase family protein [Pseudonocardia sp.]